MEGQRACDSAVVTQLVSSGTQPGSISDVWRSQEYTVQESLSYRRVCHTGVCLTGVCLTGVCLTGLCLTGLCLTGESILQDLLKLCQPSFSLPIPSDQRTQKKVNLD